MNRRQRFAEFFALKRNIVILLLALFVIGAGEELWMRFVPKYLQALGAGVFVIGVYDAIRTLLGAIYAYPGGLLADAWGHRRAFIAFNVVSIVGYALVLLIPHWAAVLVGMFFFLSWTCFSLPATFSLVGKALHASRYSMGIGIQMVAKRVPIMIAPIFGGMLVDRFGVVLGVRLALVVSIVLSTAALLVQQRLEDERDVVTRTERWNLRRSLQAFTPALRRLLVSDILVRFCERIPFAWVVIFAMDYIGATGRQIGVLTGLEVLVASLCIIPTSYFSDKYERQPFVIATFVMFTLFPIMLLFSRSLTGLAFAFFVRGLKEFGDTPRKALIIVYSDTSRRGQMVGAYYLTRDLIVSAGALIGAYLWKLGPEKNFLGAAGFGIAGTLLYIRSVREERQASLAQLKEDLLHRRSR